MFSFLLFIYKVNICISEDVHTHTHIHTHMHTHTELDLLMALLQSNFIIVSFHLNWRAAHWRFFFTMLVNFALFMFYWKTWPSLNILLNSSLSWFVLFLFSFSILLNYLECLHPKYIFRSPQFRPPTGWQGPNELSHHLLFPVSTAVGSCNREWS